MPVPADGATGAWSSTQPLVLGITPAGWFLGVDGLLGVLGASASTSEAYGSHHDQEWALDHETCRTTPFSPAQYPAYAVFCVPLLHG